jgi:hypothetical protein
LGSAEKEISEREEREEKDERIIGVTIDEIDLARSDPIGNG